MGKPFAGVFGLLMQKHYKKSYDRWKTSLDVSIWPHQLTNILISMHLTVEIYTFQLML
jgi:hypothetical protein